MGENMKNETRYVVGIILLVIVIFVGMFPCSAMPAYMNGEGVTLEAEDSVYAFDASVIQDTAASSGKALHLPGSGITVLNELDSNPTFMTSFYVSKSSMYAVWIRIKTPSSGTTILYDLEGKGDIRTKNITSMSYSWRRIENKIYSAGYKEIHITPSADTHIDKILITSDIEFNPGSAADATPDSNYVSSYFPVDSIDILPEKGVHPRLYITKDTIPEIKEKLKKDFFKTDVQNIISTANTDIECILSPDSNLYGNYSSYVDILTNRAFMYALGEVDSAHADKTVAEMKNFISTVSFNGYNSTNQSRYTGSTMVMASCVYDWCYDRLTEADKQFVIRELKEMASTTEVGFPATRRSYVISHGIEGQIYKDQLAVGIAIYDEEPDWYNTVAAIIFDKMLPVKNFLNSSGNDASGSAYAESRNEGAVHAEFMFNTLGLKKSVFTENFNKVFHTWIYNRLPNGLWFKDGDDYAWGNNKQNDTRSTLFSWIFNYVGSRYDDPYILRQAHLDHVWSNSAHSLSSVLALDTKTQTKDETDLPLTHFTTYPISSMTARTSWQNGLNAPTAMAYVNMREVAIGDHQHMDVGGFQLYYKGMLALDSGFYEWSDHYYDYQRRSIAHNVVLVHDPDEIFNNSSVNDGGQWVPVNFGFGSSQQHLEHVEKSIEAGDCITAKDTVYYAGSDTYKPEFSYISADIKPAYTDKVSAYKRSAVFVNTDNKDYPALFVVYDNLRSSDAEFKKTWLLHSEEEPILDNNKITLTRTADGYNGKLVNATIVPTADNAEFTVIGGEGKEFWADGKNHPTETYVSGNHSDLGNWRVELSPKSASEEDVFLNAMYVTDADSTADALSVYKEENNSLYGVTALDKAVYFAKNREGISTEFELNVRNNGFDKTDCFVAGCASGKWRILGNNTDIVVEIAGDKDCFAIELVPGTYTVTPADTNAVVTQIAEKTSPAENFGDFVIRKNNNLMYLPKPTKLVGGVPYAAVDGIFTQLGAKSIEKATDSITFIVGGNSVTLNAGTSTYILNGEEKETNHTIVLIDGEIYCPFEDFATLFGISNIGYNAVAKLLQFNQ